MSLGIVLIILAAAMLHATWNAIVKTAGDRTVMLGVVALGHTVPGAVMVVIFPLPSVEAFLYIGLSTVIHFGYFAMLGQAYRYGDLSVVYPIARGIVPAVVALWAFLFLGEVLPTQAWFGIGLVALGIQIPSWSALKQGVGGAALGFALATGVCISAYSLVDGVGVRLSGNTLSYWAWGAFLHLFIVAFVAVRRRADLGRLPTNTWVLGLVGGMVSMIAYGLVLYAKNFAPLGAVSALRETSVVFAALIGFFLLGEGNWGPRMLAACLMMLGVALIGLAV